MLSSSISSTFGRCSRADAIASICCSPPESDPAATFIRLPSAGKYSSVEATELW